MLLRNLFRWISLLLFLASGGFASAHTGFENETEVRLFSDRMEVNVRTTYAFAWKLLGSRAPAGIDDDGQGIAGPLLAAKAPNLFETTSGGEPLPHRSADCVFELDQHVVFLLTYDRPPKWPLVMRANFFDSLDPLSTGTLKLFDQTDAPYQRDTEPLAGRILYQSSPVFSFDPAPSAIESSNDPTADSLPGFGEYFQLGIKHIVIGYDHLLFLFALLLACRGFRQMLIIITAFTLAHSATLALAATGRVELPDRWVESFIAISIIWVGAENLLARGDPKSRAWMTFGFGLVHGFGFASVLRDIGLGADGQSIVPPLLAFNLGVEAGQLAIVAIVLPLLVFLRKKNSFVRYVSPALSACVVLAGAVWLVQRMIQ
jgi:hydrogenase/urease accessory protein HupE